MAAIFQGLVLMSPAFKNLIKFPLIDYLILLPDLLFYPEKILEVPFTSAMCTRDTEYREFMDHNPLELRSASVKFLLISMLAEIQAAWLKKNIRGPVLFQITPLDRMVDPSESRKIFKALAAPDKTLIEYPDMFHALYIDLGREKVFGDILEWLGKRL